MLWQYSQTAKIDDADLKTTGAPQEGQEALKATGRGSGQFFQQFGFLGLELGHALGPTVAGVGRLRRVAEALGLRGRDDAVARIDARGADDEIAGDGLEARGLDHVGVDQNIVVRDHGLVGFDESDAQENE